MFDDFGFDFDGDGIVDDAESLLTLGIISEVLDDSDEDDIDDEDDI